jgi:hypothetical protein
VRTASVPDEIRTLQKEKQQALFRHIMFEHHTSAMQTLIIIVGIVGSRSLSCLLLSCFTILLHDEDLQAFSK